MLITSAYGVNRVEPENGYLTVHVQQPDSFECGDCSMAGWFITASIPKELLRDIVSFDADPGNLME